MGSGTLRKREARCDADPGSRAASRRAVTSTNGSQTVHSAHPAHSAHSAHSLFVSSNAPPIRMQAASVVIPEPYRQGGRALSLTSLKLAKVSPAEMGEGLVLGAEGA